MRQEIEPPAAIRVLKPGEGAILRAVLAWSRPEDQISVDRCEELLRRPENLYLAALEGDDPVGWIGAHRLSRFRGDVAFLYEIDVRSHRRRRGIGTGLLTRFREICRQSGIYGFFVLTNASNAAAISLYRRAGGIRRHQDEVLFEFRL